MSFEPSWPMNIKYAVNSSLLLVTWCLVSKHAREEAVKWRMKGDLLGILKPYIWRSYDCFA